MADAKNGSNRSVLDRLLTESSRRILRAKAASDVEAEAEWLGAAICENEVACFLEAEKLDIEAAIHYVSAASCYARVGLFTRAVPLLRAALSFSIRDASRREARKLLKEWLPKAKKQVRETRKQAATVS